MRARTPAAALRRSLDAHAHKMPRTTLRHALKKMGPADRRWYMSRRAARTRGHEKGSRRGMG